MSDFYKTIHVKYVGEDDWGRKIYENIESKYQYKLLDGKLYTFTRYGEPDCPIRSDIEVIFED